MTRVHSTRNYNNNKHIHQIEPLKYVKETMTELKGEIDSSTVIVEDFNITISITKYKEYPKTDYIV